MPRAQSVPPAPRANVWRCWTEPKLLEQSNTESAPSRGHGSLAAFALAAFALAAFALAAVVVAVTLGTIGQIKAHVKFRSKHGWKIETNETGVSGNPLPKPKAEPKTKPAKAAKPKPAPKTGKATGRKVTKKHENGRQTVTEPVTEPAPAPDPAAA